MWLADDRTGGKIIVNNKNIINRGKINVKIVYLYIACCTLANVFEINSLLLSRSIPLWSVLIKMKTLINKIY